MYAIRSVGSVLAPYDSDQSYPCFGFGAKVPPTFQVSHCFALNGNEQNPEVVGIDVRDNIYVVLYMYFYTQDTLVSVVHVL